MKTSLDLAALIGSIDEAALQVDAWPHVLSEICALVGGAWSLLGLLRIAGGAEFSLQDAAGEPDHLALFHEKFTTPETNPSVRRLPFVSPGTIILREEEMDDDAWSRHPLYREIYRPMGLYHGLALLVLRTDRHLAALGINRPRRAGPFTQREFRLLSRILPHLQRALHVASRIAALEGLKSTYEALWDRMPQGIMVLDRNGLVLWTNRAAQTVLDAADGLGVHKGRLRAAARGDNRALARLVETTIAAPAAPVPGDGLLTVTRPSLRRPYGLLVSPAAPGPLAFGRAPAAIVILTDPEQEAEARPSRLARLFDLTPREAALAALLMEGNGLHEIAEQLRLSRNTARQHLSQVFEKTGTHRQAELVRLLLRSLAGLR